MESTHKICTAVRILSSNHSNHVVSCSEDKKVRLQGKGQNKAVKFDYCFPEHASSTNPEQSRDLIMQTLGKQMIDDVLSGSNVMLFCYGPAYPGKSSLIFGEGSLAGIPERILQELLELKTSGIGRVELFEFDCDRVRDASNVDAMIQVRQNKATGVRVEGLTTHQFSNAAQFKQLLASLKKQFTIDKGNWTYGIIRWANIPTDAASNSTFA